ncbi:MAG TPA: endonuclease III [Dehalococcoidia bacterium]|nr:endonuclease III [Dehalococcoidia bacterium]
MQGPLLEYRPHMTPSRLTADSLSALRGTARRDALAGEAMTRLDPMYGPIVWAPRFNALEELIFTVLTQHTSDINAEVAYKSLRKIFPTWMDVIEAGPAEIAEAIKHGGLANQKAPRIREILRIILERTGRLELEFLASMPLEQARAWLISLPGVGKKTTGIVLNFALGMPAMPVDTHIYRVARRLGLIGLKTNVDKAHDIMEIQIPPDEIFRYHTLLITHGRQVCKAQRPLCGECPMADLCAAKPVFEKAFQAEKYRRPVRAGQTL